MVTIIAMLLLNIYCLYGIIKSKTLQQPSTWGIVNLLCCHLIQGIVVVPSYILKRLKFQDKDISGPVCDVFRFSYMTTNYASCISLLLISADRMYAVRKPLSYRSNMTSRKMAGCILASWVYTMMLCLIPFIHFSSRISGGCTYVPQNQWTIFMLICNTLLPFLLIIYCYYRIFIAARKSFRLRAALCLGKAVRAHQLKVAKVSAAVAFGYVICWGPSFVYYSLYALCPKCFASLVNHDFVTFAMKYLTFLNGIVNPILYCISNGGLMKPAKGFVFFRVLRWLNIRLPLCFVKHRTVRRSVDVAVVSRTLPSVTISQLSNNF